MLYSTGSWEAGLANDGAGIGGRLLELRNSRGWSLRGLASRSGVSHGTIAQIENGDVPHPTVTTVLKLAAAFGIPVNELTDEAYAAEVRGLEAALMSDDAETDPEIEELSVMALAVKKLDPEGLADIRRQLRERREFLQLKAAQEKRDAKRNRPPKAPES